MTGPPFSFGLLPLSAPLPGSSFTDLLTSLDLAPRWEVPAEGRVSAPEATTVLAVCYQGGVVMAGDRQATEGYSVAHRRIQKVFPADRYSVVAISGTAGLAMELVKLFQVELEHYEKLEGLRLTLEGKANFLARLVRGQLPMAFQGLVVVPLFAGFDEAADVGRLYTFDVVGGRYEEQDYGAAGSGSREAKSFLRTVYRTDLDEATAIDISVRALVAAAAEDLATGGPDLRRNILPNVYLIDRNGVSEPPADRLGASARQALESSP